jgi:hypothetical protein
MNLQEKMQYVADEVKKVEAWAENNRSSHWYDDFVWEINSRLKPIKKFADENGIPFFVDAEVIADKHYDDTDGYSEEESSSEWDYDDSEYDESEYDEDESEIEEDESSDW